MGTGSDPEASSANGGAASPTKSTARGGVCDLGLPRQRREKDLLARELILDGSRKSERIGSVRVRTVHVREAWLISAHIGGKGSVRLVTPWIYITSFPSVCLGSCDTRGQVETFRGHAKYGNERSWRI